MTSIDWYYARGNKQMGPVSSAELKRLADAGDLLASDLVWREGLTEWAPASSVRGLFDERKPVAAKQAVEQTQPISAAETESTPTTSQKASPEVAPAPRTRKALRHPVDVLLDSLRGDLVARMVNAAAPVFRTCGLYGLLLGIIVTLAFGAIVAVQAGAFDAVLAGVIVSLILGALYYVAGRSCDALERLRRSTAVSLTTTVLPDSLAVLWLALGLAILIGSVSTAVQAAMYPLILLGVAGLIVHVYLAFAALNLSTLDVTITGDEPSVGAEAIGAAGFLLKLLLRCVPVVFGTGVLAGTLMMGYACCEVFLGPGHLLSAQVMAGVARHTLIVSAGLPLVAYLLFLVGGLLLEACRAVSHLPENPAGAADNGDREQLHRG